MDGERRTFWRTVLLSPKLFPPHPLFFWMCAYQNCSQFLGYGSPLRLIRLQSTEKGSVMGCGNFISIVQWKYGLFLWFSVGGVQGLMSFIGEPKLQKRKHQPFPYGTAKKKSLGRRGGEPHKTIKTPCKTHFAGRFYFRQNPFCTV